MGIYSLTRNEKGHIGHALIFNNYSFVPPRLGSDVDTRNIRLSLEKLGFEVHSPFIDLTAREIKKTIETCAEDTDFRNFSCLACVLMSHGHTKTQLFGIDNEPVHLINDIIAPFKDCKSLSGKPKLFFIQACRGGGASPVDDDGDSATDTVDALVSRKIPDTADMLIQYAAVENSEAVRNPLTGSYFIRSVCHVLDNEALKVNVEVNLLLRMVNERVATKYHCPMPDIWDRLRNQFYFNLERDKLAIQELSAVDNEVRGVKDEIKT
jgi:hypothetical protein